MPKPTSKKELIHQSAINFERLQSTLNMLPTELLHKEFSEGTMNRNIRDVFAHLHHWHCLLLSWYELGMKGKKPDMPSKGYTWKDTPALNKEIWARYQNTSLIEIKDLLYNSHQKIMKIIEMHSEMELFEKRKYTWTGSTSLGAYLISNTSSHYQWALKLIQKNIK